MAFLPKSLFRPRSVRTRLMIWNICAVAVLFAILGGIVRYTIEKALQAAVDDDLRKTSTALMAQAHEFLLRDRGQDFRDELRRGPHLFGGPQGPPPGPPPDDMNPSTASINLLETQRRQSYIPRIFNTTGTAMRPYQNVGAWDPDAIKRALAGKEVHTTVSIDGDPVRVLTTPVRWRGDVLGAVQSAHPLADVRQAIASVNQTLVALIPVGLLFAGLAGAVVTDRALKPVAQIARDADRIDAQDLSQRLEVAGSDEFSSLAGTFNRMLSRLEGAFTRQRRLVAQLEKLLEEQRRFTADASHELKTPLSVIKVHAGLLRRTEPTLTEYLESAESIDDAAERMSRLVQDLLTLAQSDAGQADKPKTVLVVRDLLEQARNLNRAADGARVSLKQVDPTLAVVGTEDDLVRVFSNLLANALRHTPADGDIRVSAAETDGQITVRIADTGEGIAPEHLPHLGERFYRADSSRSRAAGGSGLGLSICKSLLEQHNGSLRIESVLGKGTTVIVTIPAAPACSV